MNEQDRAYVKRELFGGVCFISAVVMIATGYILGAVGEGPAAVAWGAPAIVVLSIALASWFDGRNRSLWQRLGVDLAFRSSGGESV